MEGLKKTMDDLVRIADVLSDVRSRLLPFTVQNFATMKTCSECPVSFVKSTSVFPKDTQLNPGVPRHENKDLTCTRSVRKVSDRIFLCEHLMDYNLARLHEPTLNLSAHA